MKEKSRINLIVLLLSVTGVVLTLSGYIIGIAFYQGLLSAYGVSFMSFETATEDLYLHAFFYLTFVWIDVMGYLADSVRLAKGVNLLSWLYLVFIGVLTVLLVTVLIIKVAPQYKKTVKGLTDKVEKLYLFLYAEFKKISFLMVIFVGPVLLMAVWVLVPLNAHERGKKLSGIAITELLEKGCFIKEGKRWSNCKTLKDKDGNVIYEGILVGQSKGKVAFMTKEGSFVTKIPKGAVIENRLFKKD